MNDVLLRLVGYSSIIIYPAVLPILSGTVDFLGLSSIIFGLVVMIGSSKKSSVSFKFEFCFLGFSFFGLGFSGDSN